MDFQNVHCGLNFYQIYKIRPPKFFLGHLVFEKKENKIEKIYILFFLGSNLGASDRS